MRKLRWENNPELGFWMDNDPVRFYCGTPFSPDLIGTIGLLSPLWVTLCLDPYSALRRIEDGYVLVLEIPAKWMMDHMDQRLGNNKKDVQDRLLGKDLYLKWGKSDFEYYNEAEIRIVKQVPPRYIVGYMQHK